MRVRAEQVAVRGAHGPLLAPTSLTVEPGQVALVRGEPGAGHTEFGLALTGRMRPSSGRIMIDDRPDPARLRRVGALVDAPGVTEPDAARTLADVVGEELVLSGRRAGRRQVSAWLAAHGAGGQARDRMDTLPAALRIRLLTELAADADLLVLDRPDRHTANPQAWWPLALRQAQRGQAVVVLASTGAARLLPVPAAHLGRNEQPDPFTVGVSVSQLAREHLGTAPMPNLPDTGFGSTELAR
ncbi:MAG: ATP-binding cassette domain-containing protein [Labedaea sp.]